MNTIAKGCIMYNVWQWLSWDLYNSSHNVVGHYRRCHNIYFDDANM